MNEKTEQQTACTSEEPTKEQSHNKGMGNLCKIEMDG